MPESVLRPMTEIIPAISEGPFQATPTGLQLPKTKVSFGRWQSMGERLRLYQGAIQWAIGDWMNYGDETFNEMAPQAWNIWPEYSYDMLKRFRRVAKNIPYEERHTNITWSMHAELSGLPKSEREEWYGKLEKGLTRADLRLSLNSQKEQHECPKCGKIHTVQN